MVVLGVNDERGAGIMSYFFQVGKPGIFIEADPVRIDAQKAQQGCGKSKSAFPMTINGPL